MKNSHSAMRIISRNPQETMAAGKRLGLSLQAGDVVALIGELGSGKTVFTKGIASGLGVRDVRMVNSPTFVIIKEYVGRIPLYHFDIYRLDHPSFLDSMSYEEYFYGAGVTVVEWADKIADLLPKRRIEVRFTIRGEGERGIEIQSSAGRA